MSLCIFLHQNSIKINNFNYSENENVLRDDIMRPTSIKVNRDEPALFLFPFLNHPPHTGGLITVKNTRFASHSGILPCPFMGNVVKGRGF